MFKHFWIARVIFIAVCLALLAGCRGTISSPSLPTGTLSSPDKPTSRIIITDPLLASPTPTPKCIGDTWSYDESVQTKIEIGPDMKIVIGSVDPYVLYEKTISISGDGKVTYTVTQNLDPPKTITETKYIQEDDLQKIVTAVDEANFFAISADCGGEVLIAPHAYEKWIRIETDLKTHAVYDHGMCDKGYYFNKFCDLYDKIIAILGTPW
jgi:hypothetical protein